jgi:hypothetical protein
VLTLRGAERFVGAGTLPLVNGDEYVVLRATNLDSGELAP